MSGAGLTYPRIAYGEMLTRPTRLHPERVAVVFQSQRLTFRDLDERANALAHALRKLDIGRGDRVAVFMTNRPEYVVSFFALARLGAVPTPMNPAYREREVAYQLADAGAVAVIVQPDLAGLVRTVRRELPRLRHVIVLGSGAPNEPEARRFAELLAAAPPTPPPALDLDWDDLLVLPYSSGTTGLPKGVLLSHRAFVCNNLQFIAASRTTADDRYLVFVPLYHIYGLMLMGAGLHAGACLVLMERFEPVECCRLVEAERITLVFAVPPVLTALLHHPQTPRVSWRSVRYVMVGAAPMAPDVSRRFQELTCTKVVQGYGLTEAGPVTHMNPVHDDRLLTLETAGLPVPDCEQKVVDLETGERELPPGEVGEICVRSPGLMLGYWNAPEATAAALRGGWLYTGDIGRIDERGYVTVTDRKKEMIKYKGFGIAPAEIEALLFEHPAVADVAVIGKPDPEAGEVPKAFVVRKDAALAVEDLLDWARGRLAGYKTLHDVEFVDAIPKTASGKILRRVLTEQERQRRNP
jgi:long-chain acyl-CoA synthetase